MWQDSTSQELLGQVSTTTELSHVKQTVVVYAHGNWNSIGTARQRALMIYRKLQARSQGPVTFILYSWPSERDKGFAKDIRRKNLRLSTESHHLARLLNRFSSDTRMSFIGFSFGCPLICGALHLERGGTLAGATLPESIERTEMYRLSLTAPAFDRDRLGPNGTYRFALGNVSQIVNLYNSTDPVLKRFRFVEKGYSPVAAGYSGLPRFSYYCSGPGEAKTCTPGLKQFDCRASVGRTHSEEGYICNTASYAVTVSNLLHESCADSTRPTEIVMATSSE